MIRQICLAAVFGTVLIGLAGLAPAGEPRFEHTAVAIDAARWLINGRVTYPGARAEGLLMNVRMVNATFEDRNRDDFDPDANTAAFLAAMPEYVGAGVRTFAFNLHGGMPGYEGAWNSAFEPDSTLREIDIHTGEWAGTEYVATGAVATIAAPKKGRWLAVIVRQEN